MRRSDATLLAWSLCVAYVVLLAFALVVGQRATPTFAPIDVRVPVWASAVVGLTFLSFAVVGALISARHPANPIGWLFLGSALSAAGALAGIAYVTTGLPGGVWAEWIGQAVSVGPFTQIVFVLLLFPDGRLPSPRWRLVAWVAAVAGLAQAVGGAVTPYGPPAYAYRNPAAVAAVRGTLLQDGNLGWILLPFVMVAAAACFVVRFRTSAGAMRQQLKWFSLGAALVAAAYLILTVAWLAIWVLPAYAGILAGTGVIAFVLALVAVPVASGIAIRRYRLYDVDLLINRTLVYAALTAALGLTYLVGVVVIGSVVRRITEQSNNSLVVAASTLAVAGLFGPARARIQSFIDRRFYRHRYDVARTMEVFSAHVRDEVDLGALADDLLDVIGETMHPVHASLWLSGAPHVLAPRRRPSAVAALPPRGAES